MENIDLKNLVKGAADLVRMIAGGIAVYNITSTDNHVYQFEIDLSDKHDVGETASFLPHYDRAIILMRWIRRSIKEDTIIKLK